VWNIDSRCFESKVFVINVLRGSSGAEVGVGLSVVSWLDAG
jgi:hypothetical protein